MSDSRHRALDFEQDNRSRATSFALAGGLFPVLTVGVVLIVRALSN